jgi:hypothetical protein
LAPVTAEVAVAASALAPVPGLAPVPESATAAELEQETVVASA